METLGPSRRSFLGRLAGLAATATAQSVRAQNSPAVPPNASWLDLLRAPDRMKAFSGIHDPIQVSRSPHSWQGKGIEITIEPGAEAMPVFVSALRPVTHVLIRWSSAIDPSLRFLGDHWERSYGDLCWRGLIPDRIMPWYFLTWDGSSCHGYGVKTGAGSLCFWQVDQEGVSLWLNLCNGGNGVQLGDRRLLAATVVARPGNGQKPIDSARAFCRVMCERPRLAPGPVYGSNDWYYAYGKNSQQQTVRDADLVAELSAGLVVRPFTVIDDGWRDSKRFPDLHALADEIKHMGVRPGIWIRPLIAPRNTPNGLLLSGLRFGARKERASEPAYDPTVAEANRLILAKVAEVVEFGFELVKHDYTTYDLLGAWGFEMGAQPTTPGWGFHDSSRTNAEIIRELYLAIRKTARDQTLILGCNTVGHIAAGIFEVQRTGDDTSGQSWERTRKMGVNTLAFRLAQNGTFFAQDPDCVGITPAVSWKHNRQWLDVVARSGATLFVSPDAKAIGPEQKKAIAEAFRMAAAGGAASTPSDWLETTSPERWTIESKDGLLRYRWCDDEGADPFTG